MRRIDLYAIGATLLIGAATALWVASNHRGSPTEQAGASTISGGDTGVAALTLVLLGWVWTAWWWGRRSQDTRARTLGATTGGGPRLLRDADLEELGVRTPRTAAQAHREQLPYARRHGLDEKLETALTEHRFVLVHGPSAAGKSRSVAEVAGRLFGDRPVVVPAERPDLLSRLLSDGLVPPRSVIWLDDLDRHLDPEGGAVTAQVIQQALAVDGTRIVATIREAAFDQATVSRGDVRPRHRNVLDLAEFVPFPAMDRDDRDAAAAGLGDHPEVVAALRKGMSLGEYLSVGPDLIKRLTHGSGADHLKGRAVVFAAADWFRAGMSHPAPARLVRGTCQLYAEGAVDVFDAGLAWATVPVSGASIVTAGPDGALTLHDYVIDHLTRMSAPGLRVEAWRAIEEELADRPEALVVVAANAYTTHGDMEVAQRLIRVAAEAGHPAAQWALAGLLEEQGGPDNRAEAERWLLASAEGGDVDGMRQYGAILSDTGRLDDAVRWLRAAATSGDDDAAVLLSVALVRRNGPDDRDEAKALLRAAAARPDPNPAVREVLARLLLGADGPAEDRAEAAAVLRPAAEAGSAAAKHLLGLALEDTDQPAALGHFRDAAEAGDVDAMLHLVDLRKETDPAEAQRWARAAADAGHHEGMRQMGLLLKDANPAEAESWFRQAEEAGSTRVRAVRGRLLEEEGDLDGAEAAYRAAAEAGDSHGMARLAVRLMGQQEHALEGVRWMVKAADAGLAEAAAMLVEAGLLKHNETGIETAAPWLRAAAEAGSPDAMMRLGAVLKTDDATRAEAVDWLREAARAGSVEAKYELGGTLKDAEGRRWLQQAAEEGYVRAMTLLGGLLIGENDRAGARRWLREAAANGDRVAKLLLDGLN